MKIIYISNSTIPSATANSIHVMKMCNAFSSLGHQVTLFSPLKNSSKKNEFDHITDVYSFYDVLPSFSIKKIFCFGSRIGGYLYGIFSAVKSVFSEHDVIYTRDLTAALTLCFFGRSVFYESHAPADNSFVKKKLIGILFRRFALKKIIVITHALKDYYVNNYSFLNERIFVAPDGADPVPACSKKIDIGLDKNKLLIGYTGHLYPGKGMEIISAMASLAEWAEFHIVGGTDEDLIFWKKKSSHLQNVIFHGFQPHAVIPQFLLSFDVLVLPNQRVVLGHGHQSSTKNIGQWTSPLKAFEYMSTGKPILVSNIPVLREIFRDDYNALLCDPESPADWVKKIEMLRSDPSLGLRIGRQASKEFNEQYTWQSRCQSIEHFLVKNVSND